MRCFLLFGFLIHGLDSTVKSVMDVNCTNLICESNGKVCGIRSEGNGFKIRLFQDECDMLRNKCATRNNFVYGYNAISMYYCLQTFNIGLDVETSEVDPCEKFDCLSTDNAQVCALRQDGKGYRIRIFTNECEISKHNCENNVNFTTTDFFICNSLEITTTTRKNYDLTTDIEKDIVTTTKIVKKGNANRLVNDISRKKDLDNTKTDDAMSENNVKFNNDHNVNTNDINGYLTKDSNNEFSINKYFSRKKVNRSDDLEKNENIINLRQDFKTEQEALTKDNLTNDSLDTDKDVKKVIVIPGLLRDWKNVNETINHFFSATHVFDLPVKEMPTSYINKETRRRLIDIARPVNIHVPAVIIPNNISDDSEHKATLHSCFHKCPTTCPATYAPVCGLPGRVAREPSLMFLNHCYMDVAQCKQYWENKSPTSKSSAYQEMSFVFCLGDVMSNMYIFMPLVKTLQHMGRLPKKNRFRYKLTNLKFFNNMLNVKNPNLQG